MSRKSSRQVAAVEYAPGPSRPRRSAAAAAAAAAGNALDVKKEGDGAGMGADEVAELWAQFAADHYEIVEQLPLELHRNSRLLRELDAESLSQQTRLQAKIREYVAYRIAVARQPVAARAGEEERSTPVVTATPVEQAELPDVKPSVSPESKASTPTTAPMEARMSMPRATPLDVPPTDTRAASAAAAAHSPDEKDEDNLRTAPPLREEPTSPLAKAAPAAVEPEFDEHAAEAAVELALFATETQAPGTPPSRASKARSVSAAANLAPFPKSVNLGEISSLISELVRNREEKVAIAVGAYNTIDRHIRALDSALSAQETSVLGFAPSAEPQPEPEAERASSPLKGRNRKRKGTAPAPSESVPPGPGLPPGLEVDPNEPRYCYCNQVSYGEMVGCDNDDCPMEWFHLSCLGLSAPPVGDFLCDACKAQKEGSGASAAASGRLHKKQRKR